MLMKKSRLVRLVALVVAMMCALGASAYDFESNGIYYNITGSNTVEVTTQSQYGGNYSGALTVPSTVTNGGKTYTVTRVGKSAFRSCYDLTSVDLPTTIAVIDTSAFYYTRKLKSITIPEGVQRIEEWNFYVIDSLTTVVLPSTLQFIGDECFQSSPKLSSFTCLATTPPAADFTSFDLSFVNDCVLHVPMSSVNAYSVAEGWKKFSNIQGIQEDPGAQYDFVMDGIYYNYGYDENTGDYGPGSYWVTVVPKDDNYNSYSGVVIIPDMVTYGGKTYEVGDIAPSCFMNCSDLTAVSIPRYVTWISVSAFRGCSALTKVYCDATEPPYLEVGAFDNAHYSSVLLTVPKGCKSAYQADYNWRKFATIQETEYDFVVDGIYYNITGSNTVEVTYRNTLYGTYYGDVTVPSTVIYNGTTYNVTAIGSLAFYKSVNLTHLTLPTSITSLGDGAFARCENLPSLKIPQQVTKIPNSCFYGCYHMTNVTIPHSATSIEPYAFYQCYQLDKVVVPNNVTTIGERAFDACTGLKLLTLGTGVTTIGDYAFSFSSFEHLICRPAVPPTIETHTFGSNVQELIVPRGSINAYRNANTWNRISTVKAIGDYLAEALNPVGDFTFDSSGDYIWEVVTYSNGGYYCLGSGNRFVDNTTSVLTATVTVDKTSTLSFYFEAKGEGVVSNPWDKCVFKIDGVQQFCYGHYEPSWEQFVTDLPPGTHTLEWSYIKDGSYSTSYDYFHMWDLCLTPSLNGALNVAGGNIQFQSTGDYPWQVVQEGSRTYAMSGNAGVANSTSELTATVNVDKASTLSFDFKAWGEGTSTIYDRCSFYINNVEVFYKGAYQNDWETYSTDLEPGTYTLKWSYTKDNSVDKPGDYFAVDNVAITSAGGLRGDVNGDGNVTIADVTALIDILLSGTTAPPAADCNQDNSVSIADVTALIDYLLSGSW